VVATPIAVNSRGLEGLAKPVGRRRFKRAVGIAIGMVALGASAAVFVGLFEAQPAPSAAGPSARALPGDLFAPPPAPKPRIVVRYMAPRNTQAAPAAAGAAATASPTPSARPRPSPSPTPRGDD
jgi:hypothetical protein